MLTVFVQIITIISLIIFTGLAIAAFVILSKLFIQIKYKNYLLENLVQNVSLFVRQTYKLNDKSSNRTSKENIHEKISTKANEENFDDEFPTDIQDENLDKYDDEITVTSSSLNYNKSNLSDTLVSDNFSDELNKANNSSECIS